MRINYLCLDHLLREPKARVPRNTLFSETGSVWMGGSQGLVEDVARGCASLVRSPVCGPRDPLQALVVGNTR